MKLLERVEELVWEEINIFNLIGEKGFRWDKSIARYRDRASGRLVSEKALLSAADRYTASYITPQINRHTQRFISGQITIDIWQERMAQELKDGYIVQSALGRGGIKAMTPANYGRIGGRLNFEYRHLDQFAQEIKLGLVSDKQLAYRAKMYGNGARTAYFDGLTEAKKVAGYNEERRQVSPVENCEDCLGYEAEGWKPINYFPPPGVGSVCKHNCYCWIEYRIVDASGYPVSPSIGTPTDTTIRQREGQGQFTDLTQARKWAKDTGYKVSDDLDDIVEFYKSTYNESDWKKIEAAFKNKQADDQYILDFYNSLFNATERGAVQSDDVHWIVRKSFDRGESELFSAEKTVNGRYWHDRRMIEMLDRSEFYYEGTPWDHVGEQFRLMQGNATSIYDGIEGTVVHEYGHALTVGDDSIIAAANDVLDTDWDEWVKNNISSYASVNERELLAETYTIGSHPDFATMNIPDDVRSFVTRFMGMIL